VDRIILPLGNGDWIALTLDELAAHKAAAAALGFGHGRVVAGANAEPLCTAHQLAEALQVPRTRIEQGTREGKIPSVRVGRYHRYRRREVEAALLQSTKEVAVSKGR
jgi:excisionase family DNA binding protein